MSTRSITLAVTAALLVSIAGNLYLWRDLRAHQIHAAKITQELNELVQSKRQSLADLEAIAAQQADQARAAQELLQAVKENGFEMDRLRAENEVLRKRAASPIGKR